MKEEEMLEIVDEFLENPFSYFRETMGKDTMQIYALSISVLRDLYNYEKGKHEELEKENKELIEAWCRDYKEITGNVTEKYIPKIFVETKFIPKSKIEDKIKELESIIPPDDDYNFELMNMLDNQIQILKELLEK